MCSKRGKNLSLGRQQITGLMGETKIYKTDATPKALLVISCDMKDCQGHHTT